MADITTIEARRAAHEISKNRLCKAADIDRGTYSRLVRLPGSGRAETLGKLRLALDALVEVETRRGAASHG